MAFQWIKGSTASPTITFGTNNITLNNAATKYFENVRYCLLGIDYDNSSIGIRPISANDVEMNIYDSSQLNKVSVGKGYSRISNKTFIEEVDKILGKNCANLKFDAKYDLKEDILLIDLMEGEIKL